MKRRYLLFGAGLLVVVVLAAVALRSPPAPKVEVGKPAPGFTLTALDGRRVSLDAYRGRPVILNFWASWCGPCVTELPRFLVAQGKHSGLALVGVVWQDDPAPARLFHDRMGGDWPGLIDPGGKVGSAYLVRSVPWTYFIDAAGVVRASHFGEISQPELDQALKTILP